MHTSGHAGRALIKRADQLPSQTGTTPYELAVEPESAQATAVYQLDRNRRKVLESMRADLRALVRAESLFTADSGHPTMFLPPAYWPQSAPGNMYSAVRITPHGWHASIYNGSVSIGCAVAVGPDTTLDGAPSGEPVCRSAPRQFDF
jgi:hypothetical protein